MKILIIYNKYAGRHQAKLLSNLEQKLINQGHSVTAQPTYQSETGQIGFNWPTETPETIWILGGDGTINKVIAQMIEDKRLNIPIGIYPSGTTNVLAKELGETSLTKLDIGCINKMPFVTSVSCGLDSMAVQGVNLKAKQLFGRFAYLLSIFNLFLKGTPLPKIKVTLPGERSLKSNWVIIANTRRYAGRFILHDGSIDDGKLDLILFQFSSKWACVWTMVVFLLNLKKPLPNATYRRITECEIETDSPLQIDGDILKSEARSYQISLHPKQLSVFTKICAH